MDQESNQPAFPYQAGHLIYSGMTYRQWLVGQIVAGLATEGHRAESLVETAVGMADLIIQTLDSEEE